MRSPALDIRHLMQCHVDGELTIRIPPLEDNLAAFARADVRPLPPDYLQPLSLLVRVFNQLACSLYCRRIWLRTPVTIPISGKICNLTKPFMRQEQCRILGRLLCSGALNGNPLPVGR